MEKLLGVLLLLLLQRVASHSTVEYLPGLLGRLPFHLETGYVGIDKNEEVQLFYYFLPSESNPTSDPLLIWLAGGPGCSSLVALVHEIGPLRFDEQAYNGSLPTFVLNPHAWTKIASVIFLDQPVNTGFSYATNSDAYKYTDVQACDYVYEFIRKWLYDHPQFMSNPFYVAGNSYSGMTIPVITQLISNGNAAGKDPLINLQGYLLGNPLTFPQETNYHIPYSHSMGLISDELYKSLEKNYRGEYMDLDPNNTRCASDVRTFKQMTSKINKIHILRPNCGIEAELQGPHKLSGQRRLLHDELISLQRGVQCAGIISNWVRCRRSIHTSSDNYTLTINNVIAYHANLSTKGYRSLIYSGDNDYTIPFQSTQAWIKSLNYSIVDDWRRWNINDQIAGYTRSYSDKMTYATVKDSGHTTVSYKPEECFVMFKKWINYNPL